MKAIAAQGSNKHRKNAGSRGDTAELKLIIFEFGDWGPFKTTK